MANSACGSQVPSFRSHLGCTVFHLRQQVLYVDQVVVENILDDIEQLEGRRIVDRINYHVTALAAGNNVASPQNRKLLRKCALLDAQTRTEFIDAQLAHAQRLNDTDSEGMGESFEEFCFKLASRLSHSSIQIVAYSEALGKNFFGEIFKGRECEQKTGRSPVNSIAYVSGVSLRVNLLRVVITPC